MTSTVVPSMSRASWAWTMLGWLSWPTASISRSKRVTARGSAVRSLGKHLQGHDFLEPGLPGLVDRPHAPFAQLGQELVFAQAAEVGWHRVSAGR